MAVLLTPPFLTFFDNNGDPLSGGKVYTYGAGTTTPKATYTGQDGLTQNTNPIILDSAGRANIWIVGSYKIVVTDADGVVIRTTDNVSAFNSVADAANAYFQSFSGDGVQTAFTLTQDFGTDERLLMVFVDAGAGKGYEIQNPSAYVLNGTSLTFSVAPASGTNNIYVFAPSTLAGAASAAAAAADASATAAAASATAASGSATAAATSATNASNYAASYSGTSTTSLAVGTGAKVFTTQSSKLWVNGQFLQIASSANPANYMHGTVTSYSGTTLTMNITDIGGSGTIASWNISIAGTQGPTGPAGSGVSTVSVVSANGLAGSVANPTTTPAITLSTSITGVLKGNGTAISAAASGTDYAPATSGSSILYGNGSGGFSNVTVGSGLSFAGGTLSGGGLPAAVTGSLSGTSTTFTVDFTTYSAYIITSSDMTNTAAADECKIDVSTDGGGSYVTASYNTKIFSSTTFTSSTSGIYFQTNGTAPGQFMALLRQSSTSSAAGMTLVATGASNGNISAVSYPTSAAINRVKLTLTSRSFNGGTLLLQPISAR